MDNFNRLHQEQDDFIKKTLQADKIVNQPTLDNSANYIEKSNIKVSTASSIKIILFFLFLIIILLCAYLEFDRKLFSTMLSKTNNSAILEENTVSVQEEIISNEVTNNTIFENEISNTTKNNTISNDIIVADLTPSEQEIHTNNSSNFDLEELKALVESYSVGIQRIPENSETLEGNTILLFIAKEFFDSSSPKASLKVDTKYASTLENMHIYLKELTGKDYSNINYISSYKNYIGYSQATKSYIFGKDSSIITNEKYKCSDLEITDETNGLYAATANVTRTDNNEVETTYQITITFKVNSNYTYQKFNVKSLKAKNTSFYPDNTIHLIDQSSIVEEDEN